MYSKSLRLKISLALNWKIEIDQMKKTFISTKRIQQSIVESHFLEKSKFSKCFPFHATGNPFHQHKKYSEDTCRLKRLVITWYVKEIT